MIGRTVSHYKVIEKLGGGGMGVVYKAGDLKLDRIVALKFLPPELTRDEEAKNRFIHEAKAASALQHNNICTVHDIDETEDDQIFICMDFYDGETLKKKIEHGPLKIEDAINISIQIAQGLQKAHEKGIIHRDIKPANIFITNDGTVKILDFGLAKLTGYSVLTKIGETLGTTAYMSPEQARGDNVDNRTDVWSLGVVLYEMITGKLLFKGDYEQAVIYSILNEEPEPVTGIRSNIPMELEHIIQKSLHKNPAERYPHIDDLAVDLNLLKNDSRQTEAKHIPKTKFHKKLWPYVSATVFICAAVAVLWMLQKGDETRSFEYDRLKSIGVLPFVPLNKTSDDSLFADGIHDEILTQLSKISDLRVIARTSMILYRDTKKRLKEIADELDVGYLLEGSIRRSGNKLRITAQLINTETEGHVWADVYERDESDIFTIQADIANRISEELNLRILPSEKNSIEKPLTSNLKAYDYYMKGQYYWTNYFDSAGNSKAAEMFDSAASLDPEFVEAFAWASVSHSAMYSPMSNYDRTPDRLQKITTSLQKAVYLAPDLPEVHLAAGYYHLSVEENKQKALQEFEAALKKRPHWALPMEEIGNLYTRFDDLVRARDILRNKRNIDPVFWTTGRESFIISGALREWSTAKREAEEYLARHPDDPLAYHFLAGILISGYGDLKQARAIYEEGERKPPSVFRGGFRIFPIEFWSIEYYERRYESALKCLRAETPPYFVAAKYLDLGYTYLAMGKVSDSRVAFDSVLINIEKLVKEGADEFYYQNQIAQALAGTGKGELAIKVINKSMESYSKRIYGGFLLKQETEEATVQVYVLSGKYKEAIELIDQILHKPGTLTVWKLRLSPLYDPLRKYERFKKLIAMD